MLRYAELLQRTDAPAGSSWGLFGKDDEVGTLNFLTPERTLAAARTVRRGTVFNLDHSLSAFDPPVARHRHPPVHTIFSTNTHHRDDYIDHLYLQATTQIDGLRHFRHKQHGFYNFRTDAQIAVGSPTLGVNRYAERGIAGRGVLVDVARHLAREGKTLDHRAGEPFGAGLLDRAAAACGITFQPGDILMIRTGWLDFYFNTLSTGERTDLAGDLHSPGLIQSHDTLAWLWDHGIAVAASDNAGLEAIPSIVASPFVTEADRASGANPIHAGLMHPTMIGLLGLCIGELWDLEALAADCAEDGVYECFVTAKPLNLVGGVGSPANALAIK